MKKAKRTVKSKAQLLMELSSKKSGGLRISACWIVKNEQKNLPRSMMSVKDHVDEMIVVDTGSTDETIKIAENFGAKVFNLAWDDDFSAPRNHALEQATGNWIVFLDADEYFDEDNAVNLRPAIGLTIEQKMTAMLINLVNIDADDNNKVIDSTYLCRIFKKVEGIHYVGRIHEELRLKDGKPLTKTIIVPGDVLTIKHTGYSMTVNREKAQRNLNMLLRELETTGEPERIYGYLAQCYNGIDDYENAERYARLDIGGGRKASTFASSSHRILIKILSSADVDRLDERLEEAERAVEEFPALPEFRAELAECLAAKGEYARAVVEMQKAIRNFKSYRGMEPMIFDRGMADFAVDRIKQWSEKQQVGGHC